MRRRSFINKVGSAALISGIGGLPLDFVLSPELINITILHTNDVHSRIDPFPEDGSRNAGKGGVARRAAMIKKVRSEVEHVLLFDSGDIFQGTPYFNMFGGELEFKLMTEMGYDAATIGNHDFDAGLEGLVKQLPHAEFEFLTANYEMSDTPMSGHYKEYQVYNKGGVRIGVFGLGIELENLVPKSLCGETQYLDPLSEAKRVEQILRHEEKCDFIVCLSHLGFKYDYGKVSDTVLAQETSEVDLILGGHTHTFLDKPVVVKNLKGNPVSINQVGWAGLRIGRIDLVFERNRRDHCMTCQNLTIDKENASGEE